MKNPLSMIPYLARTIGADARDFAAGWANGLARWRSWQGGHATPQAPRGEFSFPSNPFPEGSVSSAASEAAVAYMREIAAAR